MCHCFCVNSVAADGVNLSGDIDPGWTPGDAPAAADASHHAELIDPMSKFMGEPLTVSGTGGGTGVPSSNSREVGGEA